MKTSEEIFAAALEVIALVKKHTEHVPTAMRILNVAKQGFNPDSDRSLPSSVLEHPCEGSVSH